MVVIILVTLLGATWEEDVGDASIGYVVDDEDDPDNG